MTQVISPDNAAAARALAHPTRHRILLAIPADGATVSDLSRALGALRGTVAYHLGVLEAAGLAAVTSTHTGRGGTRRIWQRTSARLSFEGVPGATEAMLASVAESVAATPETALLDLRTLRMTPAQARHLAGHLERLVAELEPAGPQSPSYGVVVGVFRSSKT